MKDVEKLDAEQKEWSEGVAHLVVDALLVEGLIDKDRFDLAVEITRDEIWARLTVKEYPPV